MQLLEVQGHQLLQGLRLQQDQQQLLLVSSSLQLVRQGQPQQQGQQLGQLVDRRKLQQQQGHV